MYTEWLKLYAVFDNFVLNRVKYSGILHVIHVTWQVPNKNKTIQSSISVIINLAMTCDFQQCAILTSVDSDEPVQLPLKLRTYK